MVFNLEISTLMKKVLREIRKQGEDEFFSDFNHSQRIKVFQKILGSLTIFCIDPDETRFFPDHPSFKRKLKRLETFLGYLNSEYRAFDGINPGYFPIKTKALSDLMYVERQSREKKEQFSQITGKQRMFLHEDSYEDSFKHFPPSHKLLIHELYQSLVVSLQTDLPKLDFYSKEVFDYIRSKNPSLFRKKFQPFIDRLNEMIHRA
jgi:hypothetical protein